MRDPLLAVPESRGSRRARRTARAVRERDVRRRDPETEAERLLATAATGRAMRPRDWWALDRRLRDAGMLA